MEWIGPPASCPGHAWTSLASANESPRDPATPGAAVATREDVGLPTRAQTQEEGCEVTPGDPDFLTLGGSDLVGHYTSLLLVLSSSRRTNGLPGSRQRRLVSQMAGGHLHSPGTPRHFPDNSRAAQTIPSTSMAPIAPCTRM